MTSTNGHGKVRAVLYAWVATAARQESDRALERQMAALGEYADRHGYEIVEEVADSGVSGVSLDRPGLNRARELVAAGSVSVVLTVNRSRCYRQVEDLLLLEAELAEHGCELRSLREVDPDA